MTVTAPAATAQPAAAAISDDDIRRGGTPALLPALLRSVAGLSLQDAQGNPFQPNFVYRGYVASPLQGTSQGLAFYVDGARFNQPFGDTVNFDLLPDVAVANVRIEPVDPAFGLNALGGAVVLATKTGRDLAGTRAVLAGGDHGWREGAAEYGWQGASWTGYLAGQTRHDGGWRRFSPSSLHNAIADIGYDGDGGGVHLKLIGADGNLTGNGSAPVELLAADRRAVFTHPDNTRNRFGRVSLHPRLESSGGLRLEGNVYAQQFRQRTLNGDTAEIEECDLDDDVLCLETIDGDQIRLTNNAGRDVAADRDDPSYGLLNRSATSTTSGGALVQIIDTRPIARGANRFAAGGSYDASSSAFRSSSELGALTVTRRVDGLGEIVAQPDGSVTPVSLQTRTRYFGAFARDMVGLGDQLSADLTLRYNVARIILKDRIGTDLNGRHRFGRLNPGIAIAYAFGPAATVRLSYAETNRVPSPAELSCAGPEDPCSFTNFFVADPPLEQVVASNWQASGTGAVRWGGWRIDWRLLGYRSANRDDIQFVASDVRGRAYFRNVGRTRRQGGEGDVRATRGPWDVRLGYALTDATFREGFVVNSPDHPDASADGTIPVERGDRLPGVPRHRGTLSLDYTTKNISVGGDVMGQTGQYLSGDEANLQPRTGGFTTANARAGARIFGQASIFVEVTNVFDRRFATFGAFSETGSIDFVEVPGVRNPRSVGPGAPRRWKLGLRTDF